MIVTANLFHHWHWVIVWRVQEVQGKRGEQLRTQVTAWEGAVAFSQEPAVLTLKRVQLQYRAMSGQALKSQDASAVYAAEPGESR
jgi:hypothetical protein